MCAVAARLPVSPPPFPSPKPLSVCVLVGVILLHSREAHLFSILSHQLPRQHPEQSSTPVPDRSRVSCASFSSLMFFDFCCAHLCLCLVWRLHQRPSAQPSTPSPSPVYRCYQLSPSNPGETTLPSRSPPAANSNQTPITPHCVLCCRDSYRNLACSQSGLLAAWLTELARHICCHLFVWCEFASTGCHFSHTAPFKLDLRKLPHWEIWFSLSLKEQYVVLVMKDKHVLCSDLKGQHNVFQFHFVDMWRTLPPF